MNTLYLQMNTKTLLDNAPLTRIVRMIKRTFDNATALIVRINFPWIYLIIIACAIKIIMLTVRYFQTKRTGRVEMFYMLQI